MDSVIYGNTSRYTMSINEDESMRGERWERTFGIELGVFWLPGSPWSHVLATSLWLCRCFSAWRPARQSEYSLSRTAMALLLFQSSPLLAAWFSRSAGWGAVYRKMRRASQSNSRRWWIACPEMDHWIRINEVLSGKHNVKWDNIKKLWKKFF